MSRLLLIIAAVVCAAGLLGAGATTHAVAGVAQCRGTDRTIPKQIRFPKGRTTAVIKDTVRLCTSHEYTLRARAGQMMTLNLATGKRTSFTLSAPSGDTVEGADGVKDWSGELPQTGDYVINIGTDATAAYTLEVTIR
ncbi:MAG: hypothetical protein ACJ754_26605 [Pyrinomonadaceae bacterium]